MFVIQRADSGQLRQANARMNPSPTTAPTLVAPDPMSELRDIHLPGAVDSWVITPGWWCLLVATIGLVMFIALRYYYHRQLTAYRYTAIDQLSELTRSLRDHQDTPLFLQQLTTLLKQVCLTSYPRARVAGLTGVDWVAFLDQTGDTSEFSMGVGQGLVDGGYAPDSNIDTDALTSLCLQWIRNHRDNEGRGSSFLSRRKTGAIR